MGNGSSKLEKSLVRTDNWNLRRIEGIGISQAFDILKPVNHMVIQSIRLDGGKSILCLLHIAMNALNPSHPARVDMCSRYYSSHPCRILT